MHEARLMHGPNTAEDLPRNAERHMDGQPPSAMALSQENRQREVGLGHGQDHPGPLRVCRCEDLQEFDNVIVLHSRRMPLTTFPQHSSENEPVRASA